MISAGRQRQPGERLAEVRRALDAVGQARASRTARGTAPRSSWCPRTPGRRVDHERAEHDERGQRGQPPPVGPQRLRIDAGSGWPGHACCHRLPSGWAGCNGLQSLQNHPDAEGDAPARPDRDLSGSIVGQSTRPSRAVPAGAVHEQTDDPHRRRRPAGLRGDHPRPAGPVRRRVPHRPGDLRRRGARRCSPSSRCAGPAGRADRRRPADAADDRHRDARAGPRARPGAKFLLLTAYADTDVAIRAINDIGLDYYLLKPWDPPEERLYPVIDDLLDDWRHAHPDHTSDVRVVGHRWSDRSHEIKTFLARNHVPYRWLDVERDAEAGGSSTLAQRRAGRPAAGPGPRRRDRCARPRPSTSPSGSGCAPGRSSRCTTSASSAADRPGSPRPCTPPPRD